MSSQQYFEKIADQWDEMRTEFFPESVKTKAFEVANLQPNTLAVDVGAGTGFISEGLVQNGLQVIAIDQSNAMLKELKKKMTKFGKIDCRQGYAENLPLENNKADYVFANMYLHHVETPSTAIKEMSRVLKAGGKLIITDLDEHRHDFLRTEQKDRWMGFDRKMIIKWFKDAGLQNVKVDCVGENCCSASDCCDDSAQISIFVAFGQK